MPLTPDTVWTVSSINHEIKTLLEKGVGSIWIEGEISNLAQPASGHWYFTLKDERAQLRAAMFRNRNGRVGFSPANGQQVLVRAQVTLYEARGEYQVIVEHLEEAGTGLLMRRFEELKKKLANEGLFSQQHKKPLPAHTSHIGIITSASGAAIRDALSVIERRAPATRVTLFPTQVQGEQAVAQIVRAIEMANRYGQCDILLLVRGGGSLEDLWCFNEEAVARAIFASTTPVVSGIGHEIDFTIADFVADHRAPTPSVAAETVTQDQYELMTRVDQLLTRLQRSHIQQWKDAREKYKRTFQKLASQHPQKRMLHLRQRLDYALARILHSEQQHLLHLGQHVEHHHQRLSLQQPGIRIKRSMQLVDTHLNQLTRSLKFRLENSQHRFELQAKSLNNLSPLNTLSRGYATVSRGKTLITAASQLESEDIVTIRFTDGEKQASVR